MEQKIILVTGASSGFGKARAERLVSEGHIVYGTSRKPCADAGCVRMLRLDVTDKQSITAAVNQIIAEQHHIDVLINNAGLGIGGAVELATAEEVGLQMGTNFGGTVNMCTVVLPFMRLQRSGLIINVSSIGGVFGIPYQGFYSASKFAIEGYSEALSLEIAPFSVKVVIVEPGDFCTGFTGSRKISSATQADADYGEPFARVLRNIERDENHGGKPEYLARKVAKIVSY